MKERLMKVSITELVLIVSLMLYITGRVIWNG